MRKTIGMKIINAAVIALSAVQLTAFPMNVMAVDTAADSAVTVEESAIKLCGGWFESDYAEWDANAIGSDVHVSVAQAGDSVFTEVDSELIRGTRVDIPGLKGDTEYTVRIAGSQGNAEFTAKTMSYDRSGYAHYNFEGIGGYNDDGTLKPDVTVIYVTNENKDTITYNGKVGLYNIFFSGKPKNVVFRFIGSLDVPSGTVANDGSHNDGSNMVYLQNSSNVTVEGIGPDTDLKSWGIEMKRCTSCEFRNLWLGNYPDDGIAMTGNVDIRSAHIWVHNNTIERGYNQFAGNGHVDADKAEGDGSVDMKWSEYVTVSYNEFRDCHKTSLVGGKADQMQDYITYHHNWFNNTQSRNPRARNAHIHSYNNLFSTNSEYGICASYNSKIFSECNYFEKAVNPLYAINMGKDKFSGTIKSFGDKFDNCDMGGEYAYKIAESRNESVTIPNLVEGGDGYDNFDLELYSYDIQSPDEARASVMELAGRMKTTANSGEVKIPEQNPDVEPVPQDDPVILMGDINDDGAIGVADAVVFSKWLLGSANLTEEQGKRADMITDGELNVFDLTALKKCIIDTLSK